MFSQISKENGGSALEADSKNGIDATFNEDATLFHEIDIISKKDSVCLKEYNVPNEEVSSQVTGQRIATEVSEVSAKVDNSNQKAVSTCQEIIVSFKKISDQEVASKKTQEVASTREDAIDCHRTSNGLKMSLLDQESCEALNLSSSVKHQNKEMDLSAKHLLPKSLHIKAESQPSSPSKSQHFHLLYPPLLVTIRE
ncbi:hypothetical protein LAZ67_16002084 [Cordylochernes scorpioides]|uniref:Uncharacterized protein n=1 Tax=Cordylochernes scorpioides TaxID=51811 RepID=A0ABY6LBP6_9ARAC|nr:hypothetical protein LAZ67_16002084 [Cordylochernes scorpioides]